MQWWEFILIRTGSHIVSPLDACFRATPGTGSQAAHEQHRDAQLQTTAAIDSAAAWRTPVVVGGRTGRAYELIERVSYLPRDQRFRQIYPRSDAVGGRLPSIVSEGGALPKTAQETALLSERGGRQSGAAASGVLPADSHGSTESEPWQAARSIAPPPTRLTVLRQSLATALTQLWPWGRGPQEALNPAATCPAHLDGGAWETRQLAPAHSELVKVPGAA